MVFKRQKLYYVRMSSYPLKTYIFIRNQPEDAYKVLQKLEQLRVDKSASLFDLFRSVYANPGKELSQGQKIIPEEKFQFIMQKLGLGEQEVCGRVLCLRSCRF